MNHARIDVSLQGVAHATRAHAIAAAYAAERSQGRKPDGSDAVLADHADIRRMLDEQRSLALGARAMAHITLVELERGSRPALVDFLTPLCKIFCTQSGVEAADLGLQILGGYGYLMEYGMAQTWADARITMIYEGTNGIQAMDLLGRKLGMNKGKAVMDLMGEIQKTIAGAREIETLKGAADTVDKMLNKLGEVAMHMGGKAMSPEILKAFAHAHPFMEVTGDVVMAWMLLWRATVASQKLAAAKKKDKPFYEGQLKSCEYFIETVLPVTFGKMKAILGTCGAAIDIDENAFCSK
jgi:hypothetical protein